MICWEIFTYAQIPYYDIDSNKEVSAFVVQGGRLTRPSACPDEVWPVVVSCWNNVARERPTFEVLRENLSNISTSNALL